MITALLVGVVVGFVLAIPPGPIAMACVQQGLVLHHAWALLAFQGGCIVVLVVLGLRYCRLTTHEDAARARQEVRGRPRGDASPYLSGVLIALTNLASPTFLPSLIFAMSLVHVRGLVGHTVGANVMYALGFGTGGALWFVLLVKTLTHFRAQFSPTVILLMYRVAGGVFLLFAVLLTYTVVTTTAWARLPGW